MLYFCSFVLAFSLGAGPVPGLLLGEIFPNKIRAKAMAVCMCVHWVSTSQFDHIYWIRLSMNNLPLLLFPLNKYAQVLVNLPMAGAAAWGDFRLHCCMIISWAWKSEIPNLEGCVLVFTLLIDLILEVLQPCKWVSECENFIFT